MTATTTPTYDSRGFLGSDPNANRLYDNVQAIVPAVTYALVQMELWNTIEEFYIRSTYERREVNWTMAVGVQQVDFNPYDESWLVAWVLAFTGLYNYRVVPPGVVMDLQSPAAPRAGCALLALKPVQFCTDLSPDLWSTWFETIKAGVLYKLYSMPAKPFTSPQGAALYGKQFMAGINKARAIAQQQYTDGPGRWRFPYFATGHRKQ